MEEGHPQHLSLTQPSHSQDLLLAEAGVAEQRQVATGDCLSITITGVDSAPLPQPDAIQQAPKGNEPLGSADSALSVGSDGQVRKEEVRVPSLQVQRLGSIEEGEISDVVAPSAGEEPRAYTLEQRLRDANTLKVKGNDFYKQREYEQATKAYTESLSIAHPDLFSDCSQQLMYKMAELNVALLQNLAAAYYATKQFDSAERIASQVLLINPKHFKALYRRALCLFELNRLEEAYQSIKDAFAIDNTVGEVNDAYRKIHAAYKAEKEANKKLYKSMFGTKQEPAPVVEQPAARILATETGQNGKGGFIVGAALSALSAAGVFLLSRWSR